MYAAAQTRDAEGHVRLDAQRFARALAEALLDPMIEQELYSRALLAAADGDSALFAGEPIALQIAS